MALGPFRTLARAHLEGSWNRLRRLTGRRGPWVLGVTLVLLLGLLMVPLGLLLAVVGWQFGPALGRPDAEPAIVVAAAVLTGAVWVAGVVGGLTSGSRQLPWERLRGFPVRSSTLFAAELFAGACETLTLLELVALAVALGSVAVREPRALPTVLLLFGSHGLQLLGLQQLAGSLAQRLSRNLRMMLLLLPIGALSMSWAAPMLAARGGSLADWAERLDRPTRGLPTRLLLEATRDALVGQLDGAALATASLSLLLSTGIVLGLAGWAVARERPLAQPEHAAPPQRLWSFSSSLVGVARLEWVTLAQSLPGRFSLLMPLVSVIFVRGPLATLFSRREWTASIAFGYTAFAGTQLLFNQFGLDRHGAKGLFLLPISARTLLGGKLLGFTAWQGLQALLLGVLLSLTGRERAGDLALGLLVYATLFLVMAMVGQRVSVLQPSPLGHNGLRAAQPPLSVLLLMFGTSGLASALVSTLLWVVHRRLPGWELPLLAATCALLGALLPTVLSRNAALLERERERVVEIVGGTG